MNSARSVVKTVASLVAAIPFAALATAAHAALVIGVGPTTNVTCASQVCTATAADAHLSMKTLRNLLASGDVKVVSGSSASDIVVAGALTWISSSTLTLDSYHSIIVNKPVSVAGTGGLVLTTNDGGTNGSLIFRETGKIDFLSTANQLILNGDKYKLESNIKMLAYDIARDPGGHFALANSYDASADGVYSVSPISTPFHGVFNGLGNIFSKVTIVDETDGNVGFFANVLAKGALNNVVIIQAVVRGSPLGITSNQSGGLAGLNSGTISNSFVGGAIYGATAGGLVAENIGVISHCRSSALVHGGTVGGITGTNGGSVTSSFATGAIAGENAGGLSGLNSGNFINSYSTGVIAGRGRASIGGLIGFGYNSSVISTSYSSAAVSGKSKSEIGGIVGAYYHTGETENVYWDTTTSGITDLSRGAGNVSNAPGITGLSTAQLQSGLPPGFDPAIWAENPSINGGLPYLLDNPPPG